MIRLPIVLFLSLVTNLVLGSIWRTSRPNELENSASPYTENSHIRVDLSRSQHVQLDSTAGSKLVPSPEIPSSFDDLARWVALLRQEGFPTDTMRALVNAWLDQNFRSREEAIKAAYPQDGYWAKNFRRPTFPWPAERRLLELKQEKASLLRGLLGEAAETDLERHQRRRKYGDISPEKVAQLERIQLDYQELSDTFTDSNLGFMLPTDLATRNQLHAERDLDIASVLTPIELAEYQLRNGAIATTLRGTLRDFGPTEEEFRALHSIEIQFATAPDDPAAAELRATILGPERYAEFEFKSSPAYREASSFGVRQNLSPEIIAALAQLRINTAATANTWRSTANSNSDPSDLSGRLIGLQKTTLHELTSLLGPELVESYAARYGRWFKAIATELPTPAKSDDG